MKSFWKPLSLAIGISLLLHALGGFIFRASAITDTPPLPKPPLVTFLSPTAYTPSIESFRQEIALADPSASSLPNPRGFSSRAIARTNTAPSEIETRKVNPQLLPLATNDPFMRMLVAETKLPVLLAAFVSKQPALPVEETDVRIEMRLPPTGSGFELDGIITNRPLLTLPGALLAGKTAPPQPTVVRVAVSPLGEVKFAVLEKTSGLDDHDTRALDEIRRWRFQAVPDNTGDQWGAVLIYWAAESTAPPAPATETNAPAKKDEG